MKNQSPKPHKSTMEPIVIDKDIEKLLNEIYLKDIRKTDEYMIGRIEERVDAEKEKLQKSFQKIVAVSEFFYNEVKKQKPSIHILQHRIGLDYSSGAPAVLMIVSPEDRSKVKDIRKIARMIEKASWSHSICEGFLWTKTDDNLDQKLVEHDFPYYRKHL